MSDMDLGIPPLVIALLREQLEDKDYLSWNIFKSGSLTKLTLSWHLPDPTAPVNNHGPQIPKGMRKKSPSELRRDFKRNQDFKRKKAQQNAHESKETTVAAKPSISAGRSVAHDQMSVNPPPPRITRSIAKKHTEDRVDSLENPRIMSVSTDTGGDISALHVTLDSDWSL